ncbi:MAG: recombination mediator RecR [Chlamydiales bacterium]
MHYPKPLSQLIAIFQKLPGVGIKTAERFAFHVLNWPEEKLADMASIIKNIKKNISHCLECGSLVEEGNKCTICYNKNRNSKTLCIVASVKDVFLIEETREYTGLYHVLGTLFSPIHGLAPSKKTIDKLKARIVEMEIREIIIALDATLEGDATSLYLKKELTNFSLSVSRLALGLPMGSSLDFIDGGTLARAFSGRHAY